MEWLSRLHCVLKKMRCTGIFKCMFLQDWMDGEFFHLIHVSWISTHRSIDWQTRLANKVHQQASQQDTQRISMSVAWHTTQANSHAVRCKAAHGARGHGIHKSLCARAMGTNKTYSLIRPQIRLQWLTTRLLHRRHGGQGYRRACIRHQPKQPFGLWKMALELCFACLCRTRRAHRRRYHHHRHLSPRRSLRFVLHQNQLVQWPCPLVRRSRHHLFRDF